MSWIEFTLKVSIVIMNVIACVLVSVVDLIKIHCITTNVKKYMGDY